MQEHAEGAATGVSNVPADNNNEHVQGAIPSTSPLDDDPAPDALHKELAKWRERVPKLAAALRERTQEVDALRQQLHSGAGRETASPTSGIKARDALIEELEAKLKAQSARHQDAQGQLHARDVEVAELTEEVAEWREKWQSATETLDEHAHAQHEKDSELTRARGELEELRGISQHQEAKLRDQELEATALRENVESLEARNAKLFETTEMANRQIESLGDNLGRLREQTRDRDRELAERDQRTAQLEAEIAQWAEKVTSRDRDVESLHEQLEQRQQEMDGLNEQLRQAAVVATERDDLLGQVAQLESTRTTLEEEGRVLDARLTELAGVRKSLDESERALAEATQAREHLEAHRTALEDEVRAHEAHIAELENATRALEDARAEIDAAAEERAALVAEREAQAETIRAHEAHIAELENATRALEDARAEINTAAEERAALVAEREAQAETVRAQEARIAELETQGAALDAAERGLAESAEARAELEASFAERAEDLERQLAERDSQLADLQQAREAQDAEVSRLEECISRAEETNGVREDERRDLSEQLAELKARAEHLEAQLSERSELVLGLEQEKGDVKARIESLETENVRLGSDLEKARRHADEHADHIAQIDSKLQRQKELMQSLEIEYAEAQQEAADAGKAHTRELNAKEEELIALREKIDRGGRETAAELETAVAEREGLETRIAELEASSEEAQALAAEKDIRLENLHREIERVSERDDPARVALEKKIEQLETELREQNKATVRAEEDLRAFRAGIEDADGTTSADAGDAGDLHAENEVLQQEIIKLEGMVRDRTEQLNKLRWQREMNDKEASSATDEKMLVVLNQQLSASREDNARMVERINDLEAVIAGSMGGGGDDLTRIRGVGRKLVEQLAELGITSFTQIASLTEAELEDEKHVLHTFRGRIIKDEWIPQATDLCG